MGDVTTGIFHRQGGRPAVRRGLTVDALVGVASTVAGLRRRDVRPGDRLIVSTRNSIYSLEANADGSFIVDGGWYSRTGSGPAVVDVLGCTAGGHALFCDVVAARGMFLELSDGTRTTRIRSVRRLADGSA